MYSFNLPHPFVFVAEHQVPFSLQVSVSAGDSCIIKKAKEKLLPPGNYLYVKHGTYFMVHTAAIISRLRNGEYVRFVVDVDNTQILPSTKVGGSIPV